MENKIQNNLTQLGVSENIMTFLSTEIKTIHLETTIENILSTLDQMHEYEQ